MVPSNIALLQWAHVGGPGINNDANNGDDDDN